MWKAKYGEKNQNIFGYFFFPHDTVSRLLRATQGNWSRSTKQRLGPAIFLGNVQTSMLQPLWKCFLRDFQTSTHILYNFHLQYAVSNYQLLKRVYTSFHHLFFCSLHYFGILLEASWSTDVFQIYKERDPTRDLFIVKEITYVSYSR